VAAAVDSTTTTTTSGGFAEDTLAALRQYALILQQHKVASVKAVGTAALRECSAAAAERFQQAAAEAMRGPCGVEIVSGEAEGAFAFAGATSSVRPPGQDCLVLDLGGRSTELCFGAAGSLRPELVTSVPLGCLAVQRAARGVGGWMAAAEKLLDSTMLSQQLQQRRLKQQQQQQSSPSQPPPPKLVATGGTVTTAVALLLQLPQYDSDRVHMSRISRRQLLQLAEQLSGPAAQQQAVAQFRWLTPERAASIAPGCAALAAVMGWLSREWCRDSSGSIGGDAATATQAAAAAAAFDELIVSDRDLLDGVAMQLLSGAELR